MKTLQHFGESARPDRLSFWMASVPDVDYGSLAGDVDSEVAIVGAGIVGLTAALSLAESGRKVVVVEADRVAAGVSGYTTAKVTAGHGFIYSYLETLEEDAARKYAESQLVGLAHITELCSRYAIECDLEAATNYVVVESDDQIEALEAELAAADRAGLAVSRIPDMSAVPFPAVGGLMLENQAQFHVRKYLLALARLAVDAGVRIYDNSRVVEISGGGPYDVKTVHGTVRTDVAVVATHYPIVEQGFFVTRIHPRRSYVVAAPLKGPVSEGMFINSGSPTRSVRTASLQDGRRLLLVGGEGHRVGQQDNAVDRYTILEEFMHEHFSVEATEYRWSTQDNHSVDRLPYVGRVGDSGDLYVATGFAGWGMSNGSAAALALSAAALGAPKAWATLYDLDRRHLAASAKSFLIENTKIAASQLGRAVGHDTREIVASVDAIQPGQGAIVETNGSKQAVSRDNDGELYAVSASCTHMGCSVNWNAAESTWDCPCHGSRFAPDGHVLHGPALQPLDTLVLPDGTQEQE